MNKIEVAEIDRLPPWMRMKDDDIYVLNPLYRLRNARDHVVACGADGMGIYHLHKMVGVILALCNGQRTVADIVRITKPLVRGRDALALQVAKGKVKDILDTMAKTQEEQQGRERTPVPFPSASVLVSKAFYNEYIRQYGLSRVDYDARVFLPKESSEINNSYEIRVMHEPAPITLNWHFTPGCPTNGKHLGERNVQLLPRERVLSLVQEAADIGVLSIMVRGGDVLLYPHLKDVLALMCKRKFLPMVMSTNSFLDRERAKEFAEVSSILWSLRFSIDSAADDVAACLVGEKKNLAQVLTSIDNAIEAGLRVSVRIVVTSSNVSVVPKLCRNLKQQGVSAIQLATRCRNGHQRLNERCDDRSLSQLQNAIDELRNEFSECFIELWNEAAAWEGDSAEGRRAAWLTRSCCTAGRSGMMICPDGKVLPCEQMPQTEQYYCGDLSHQSIQDVWDGIRLREMTYGMPREKFKDQACHSCREWEECSNYRGYCIADLATNNGNIYQAPASCPKL